jgi:hypothetical protein
VSCAAKFANCPQQLLIFLYWAQSNACGKQDIFFFLLSMLVAQDFAHPFVPHSSYCPVAYIEPEKITKCYVQVLHVNCAMQIGCTELAFCDAQLNNIMCRNYTMGICQVVTCHGNFRTRSLLGQYQDGISCIIFSDERSRVDNI